VSRKYLFKKRKSTSSLIEVILLRGFLGLVLVFVVIVFSLGLMPVIFFIYQYFLCFLSKGLRQVSESFLISLFSIVSDSLRSTVYLKSIFGIVLSLVFPFHLIYKKIKISYFTFLILKHKKKKISFLCLVSS